MLTTRDVVGLEVARLQPGACGSPTAARSPRTRSILATGVVVPAADRARAGRASTGRGVFYGSAATEAPDCTGPGRLHRRRGQLGRPGGGVLRPVRPLGHHAGPRRRRWTASMSHYLIQQIDGIEQHRGAHPHRGRRGARRRPPGAADAARPTHRRRRTRSTTGLAVRLHRRRSRAPTGSTAPSTGTSAASSSPGPTCSTDGQRPRRLDRWTATRTTWRPACPGVFVAGDVRADSVKRVASAVGEGAMAVTLVHRYLEEADDRHRHRRHAPSHAATPSAETCSSTSCGRCSCSRSSTDEQLDWLCRARPRRDVRRRARSTPRATRRPASTCCSTARSRCPAGSAATTSRSPAPTSAACTPARRRPTSATTRGTTYTSTHAGDHRRRASSCCRPTTFADVMRDWFPMAMHLLEGLFFGMQNTQRAVIGERERLLALGSLSAGLTHELNNPAAAAVRATSALRDRVAGMRHKLAHDRRRADRPAQRWNRWSQLQEEAVERVAKAPEADPDGGQRPRGRSSATGSTTTTITGGWDIAPTSSPAGSTPTWLDEVADSRRRRTPRGRVRWLDYTVETELLMNEIEDATTRISDAGRGGQAVLAAGPRRRTRRRRARTASTARWSCSSRKIGDGDHGGEGVRPHAAARSRPTPRSSTRCGPTSSTTPLGAMGGAGHADGPHRRATDDCVLRRDRRHRPGHPAGDPAAIFEPFFTTKPVGEGTGLGPGHLLADRGQQAPRRHEGDSRAGRHPVPGARCR